MSAKKGTAMEIGRHYEITLKTGAMVRGLLRSIDAPSESFLNNEGPHRIWLGGEGFEWFIRPELIVEFTELDSASA